MLIAKDRIKELTSTTGAGTLTLTGAEAGFQAFSVLGNATKCYYTITDVNSTDWEVGQGTYNSNTLTRDVVLESSNSGTAISLSATGSTVFVTYPANKSAYSDVGVNRDYLASGNIDAGKPLILNTDNSVTQVAETPSTIPAGLGTKATTEIASSVYDQQVAMGINGQFVSAYRQGSDFMCQVNTISSDDLKTITHGTSQLTFNLSTGTDVAIVYQPNVDKYVLFYRDGSNYLTASVMTLSGTGASATLTAATPVTIMSDAMQGNPSNNDFTYDTSTYLIIGSWRQSNVAYTCSMSISGTTITGNSSVTIPIPSTYTGGGVTRCSYSSTANKIVYLYTSSADQLMYTTIGTVSGTTINFGSAAVVSTPSGATINASDMCVGVDSNGVVVLSYLTEDLGTNYSLWSQAGTLSGTTITWGTASQVSNVIALGNAANECTIGSIASGKMIIARGVNSTSPSYLNKGIFVIITSSGTTVTNGTVQEYSQTDSRYPCVSTNYSKTQAVINWGDSASMDMNNIIYLESAQAGANETNLSNNYFGVASTNVVSGEQVGVNRSGSFNNNQSGMTAGVDQYVTSTGLIKERTTTTTVTDSNPTVSTVTTQDGSAYSNGGNSISYESTSGYYVRGRMEPSTNYPVVESGTWTSNSAGISWGTPTVLSSNNLRNYVAVTTGGGYSHVAYCTRENSNENAKITPVAISGSGAITLGTTTTVFTKATTSSFTDAISVEYDTSSNTIISFFNDGSTANSSSIIVASPLQMNGANYSFNSSDNVNILNGIEVYKTTTITVFDPDTQRTIFFYTKNNSPTSINGIVISCTGTTISLGATQTASFNTKPIDGGWSTATYDTQNNKIVFVYEASSPTNSAKYSIVTVTGGATNTLSYTADAYLFSNTSTKNETANITYDADANKLLYVYPDYFTYHFRCNTLTSNGSSLTSTQDVEISSEEWRENTPDNTSSIYVNNKGVAYSFGGRDGSYQIVNFTQFFNTVSTTVVNGSQFVGTARGGTDLELSEPPVELVGMANGSITKGKPVILRTDEDFEQVSQSNLSVTFAQGSEIEVLSGWQDQNSLSYDITQNKFLVAYRDQDRSLYGYCKVLSVSGTTVSYGSESSSFSSAGAAIIDSVYDAESGNHVIFYYNTSNQYGYSVVATISGTSVTFGTPIAFQSSNTNSRGTCFYDSADKKVVWVGGIFNGSTYSLKAIVGTVSGTSINFGTISDSGVTESDYYSSAYDKNSSVGVYAYMNAFGDGYMGTLSISGTSITWNTPVNFYGTTNVTQFFDSMTYDSVNKKIIHTFRDSQNGKLMAIVATISGTSLSLGTVVEAVSNANGGNTNSFSIVGTNQGAIPLVYRDANSPYYLKYLQGTVSGTSISFSGGVSLNSQSIQDIPSIAYSTNDYGIVTAYAESSAHDLQAVAVTPSGTVITNNLNATNFIGFAQNTVSDNEDVKVAIISQSDENQSGLTTASQYYVQVDGTLSTTAGTPSVLGGTALSSTKILIKS